MVRSRINELLSVFGWDVKDKDFVRQEKILESQVFNYYVSLISKPYSDNYYSFAKNYIKNFSLPELNTNEKNI